MVYKIYSIEEAVVEDRSQVEEVDHRSHHQSTPPKKVIIGEDVNHQIEAEEAEVVVEVEHVVVANIVNLDEIKRMIIQI